MPALRAIFAGAAVALSLSGAETIAQTQTWSAANPGNLLTSSNWSDGVVPNGTGRVARFSSQPSADGDFTLDGAMTVGTISYNNPGYRWITGAGTLTFNGSPGLNAVFLANNGGGDGTLNLDVASVVLTDPTEFQIHSGGVVVNSTISGGDGIIKSGPGYLVLNGNNSYQGTTVISQGFVYGSSIANASANSSFGRGNFAISDYGVLAIQGSGSTNRSLTLTTGGGVAVFNSGFGATNTVTWTGVISGAGALVKHGDGVLQLQSNNAYTVPIDYYGGTHIFEGTLRTGTSGAVPASSAVYVASGATFDLAGSSQTIAGLYGEGAVTLGAANLSIAAYKGFYSIPSGTFFSPYDYGFAGTISGSGGLTKRDVGTQYLSGVNSYSGGTTISGGTLSGNSIANSGVDSAFGRGGFTLTNGGVLEYAGVTASTNRSVLLGTGGGVISVTAPTTTLSMSGVLSGADGGGLAKSGAGALLLGASNTYTGPTHVLEGTLRLGASESLPNGSAVTVANSAVLDLNGFNETIGSLSGGSATAIVNLGPVSKLLVTGGNNSSTTYAGRFAGSGSLEKVGSGAMTLTGVGSTAGPIVVNGGSLGVTNGGSVTAVSGQIGQTVGSVAAVNVGGGAGVSAWNSSGTITVGYLGSGTLNITGGGRVMDQFGVVGGQAGSTGVVNIGGGTGSSLWLNSHELWVGGLGTGALNITGGGGVASQSAFVGRSAGGTGVVNVGGGTGPATWVANSFIDVGTLGSGTLNITGGGSVTSLHGFIGDGNGSQNGTGVVSVGGGSGEASWSMTGVLSVGGPGSGTLNVNSGGTIAAAALDGGNATSSVNFNGGMLRITGTDSASNTINLQAGGGTIDVPTAGTTFTITSPIAGAGGLTKTGQATLALTGASSYSGGTIINSGMVHANNSSGSATGSGLVTIFGGALGGFGAIAGNVSFAPAGNGTLAPGASAGTLALLGNLTLDPSTTLSFELNGANPIVGASLNDLVTVAGDLALNGTLSLFETIPGSFAAAPAGRTWRLINYGGVLSGGGISLGSMPSLAAGLAYQVDTSIAGQVNLLVTTAVPEAGAWLLVGAGAFVASACRKLRRK